MHFVKKKRRAYSKKKSDKKKESEKGLSTVVATLLLILLTLVAVGVIWVVVRNVIQSNSEQVFLGKYTLNLEITKTQRINDSTLNVTVKRNAGEGEFIGMNFVVEDDANTEVIKKYFLLKELETQRFQLFFNIINATKAKKISVVPIFKLESGKEVNGDVKDEYDISNKSTCTAETDTVFCSRLGKNCNSLTGTDNCGNSRTVSICGTCPTGYTCPSGTCVIIRNLVWASNSTIKSGLSYIGSWSAPTVFYKDSSLYMLVGGGTSFKGFVWSGTQWLPNSTINASLPSIICASEIIKSSVFQRGSDWYLIVGDHDENWHGFKLNGANWETNNSIVLGLTTNMDMKTYPTVFQKDGTWYLISGGLNGNFYGYAWNGTQWLSNSTIVSGLPSNLDGGYTTPTVFQKDSSWYLIAGADSGNFYGYAWNGAGWSVNLTINASLPDIGESSRLSVFYKDSDWYLISGDIGGNFYGFVYT